MPLNFHSALGTIVICNYDDVVVEPEMRKARPVVVISPRLRRRPGLVTIVPLNIKRVFRISRQDLSDLVEYLCRVIISTDLLLP